MLPTMHPLHKPINNVAKRLIKKHPTPLHDLMHRYNIQPTKLETIKATRFDTKWRPQVTTLIAPNTDIAISNLREVNVDAKIFTDGSGANNKIGASTVLYRNGRPGNSLQFLLGSIHQHTVYEGEVIRVLLALHVIWGSWWI